MRGKSCAHLTVSTEGTMIDLKRAAGGMGSTLMSEPQGAQLHKREEERVLGQKRRRESFRAKEKKRGF